MRFLFPLLAILFLGCAGSRLANSFASKQVQVEYDKFKDITSYQSYPPIVVDTDFLTDLEISASFTCIGQRTCVPDKVYLKFYSSSQNGYQYNVNSDLIFIADGERINLGTLLQTGWRDRVLNTYVREILGTDISTNDLAKLANATTVEGRLGKNEFKLSYEDRLVLRMLLQKATSTN